MSVTISDRKCLPLVRVVINTSAEVIAHETRRLGG